MSHNVTLSGVRITDLDLLASCVKDMSGGAATLVKNQKRFRTYRGQDPKCDHCITMPGAHDIGLTRQDDGSFRMVADFSMLDNTFAPPEAARAAYMADLRERQKKFPVGSREYYAEVDGYYGAAKAGRLLQEYTLRTMEVQAAMMGRTTQRVPAKNGVVTLEVMG